VIEVIEKYRFGQMTINGVLYRRDLIIAGDRIQENWYRKRGHQLILEDIQETLDKVRPATVVIGTGKMGMMRVDPSLAGMLREKGIEVVAEPTGRAVILFNRLVDQGEHVLGAFHITC
jgi:hypothetical protein